MWRWLNSGRGLALGGGFYSVCVIFPCEIGDGVDCGGILAGDGGSLRVRVMERDTGTGASSLQAAWRGFLGFCTWIFAWVRILGLKYRAYRGTDCLAGNRGRDWGCCCSLLSGKLVGLISYGLMSWERVSSLDNEVILGF